MDSYELQTEAVQTLPIVATALWNAYKHPDEYSSACCAVGGGTPEFWVCTSDFGEATGRIYFSVKFTGYKDFITTRSIPEIKGKSFNIEPGHALPENFDPVRFERALKTVQEALGLRK